MNYVGEVTKAVMIVVLFFLLYMLMYITASPEELPCMTHFQPEDGHYQVTSNCQ